MSNRGKIRLYRKRRAGTRAYKADVDHTVYMTGEGSIGAGHVPKGYFVIVDEYGRSKRILSPESFHKIYELVEDADCSETQA